MYTRWREDVGGQGTCCSVMLMGTMEPRSYQMREITAKPLLFSDWSGCVNLLALIGPQRQKTKSMFRSKASFNFQSRCSQMSFLSSEASASAIKLFRAMTGECMCSALYSLKAKCLVWPLPLWECAFYENNCREKWRWHKRPSAMSLWKAIFIVINGIADRGFMSRSAWFLGSCINSQRCRKQNNTSTGTVHVRRCSSLLHQLLCLLSW